MNAELQNPDADPSVAEDSARAGCYALIGRLFYESPDAGLLKAISASPAIEAAGETGALAPAWAALQAACHNADADALSQEYDRLFIGVGKAAITLYTSRYADTAADKHLVRLREELAALGFMRRSEVFEIEDHISGLCDVMRLLIENNQSLEDQRQFFNTFIQAGAVPLCDAVEKAEQPVFYKHVAGFARAFILLEKMAFEMAD